MGPHGSWLRAFNEAVGHTVYWIAAFVILAGALVAYTRYDARRKKAEAEAALRGKRSARMRDANPADDLPPDDR